MKKREKQKQKQKQKMSEVKLQHAVCDARNNNILCLVNQWKSEQIKGMSLNEH